MIMNEHYYVFPRSTLTICRLTLPNRFTVTGEAARASPENFDAEIGRKITKQMARDKVGQLEGDLRRSKFAEGIATVPQRETILISSMPRVAPHASPRFA